VMLWNMSGIGYLDVWSARRPPTARSVSTLWPLPGSARSRVDGMARFMQFQEQLSSLIADSTIPTSIRADAWFRFLPPAGVFPLTGANKGVQLATFLQEIPLHDPRPPGYAATDGPVFLEGARLLPLLEQSFAYPPVELTPAPIERIALWLYRLRENAFANDTAPGSTRGPAIVFASAQMPSSSTPRFDVARFDYSNYFSTLLGPI
jgi:hypothetical protein